MGGKEDAHEVEGEVTVVERDSDTEEPGRFAVVLHNDNYTTMEFVIEVLQRFFHKSQDEASKIMLKVHNEGRGVAGIYHLEIAETKCAQVNDYAKTKGFPLKASVEPVGIPP